MFTKPKGPRMVSRDDVGRALDEHEYRERVRAEEASREAAMHKVMVIAAERERRKRLEQERRWALRRDRRRAVLARLLGRR